MFFSFWGAGRPAPRWRLLLLRCLAFWSPLAVAFVDLGGAVEAPPAFHRSVVLRAFFDWWGSVFGGFGLACFHCCHAVDLLEEVPGCGDDLLEHVSVGRDGGCSSVSERKVYVE